MSSSFEDSFDQYDSDSPAAIGTDSFGDGYLGPESLSNFDLAGADAQPPIYVSGGEFASDPVYFASGTNENSPILPPLAEVEPEEGYALREWRRQNTIRLEEKEKREKELLSKIVTDAEEYKVEFHRKMQLSCETNKTTNREKETLFVAGQEKSHAEADKDYWKSIADLIPKEVPTIEKRKSKKEPEKKPPIAVVQGPKPGKPTELNRMRQIVLKLKHNTPPHLKPSPPPATDANAAPKVAAAPPPVSVA